MSLENLGRVVNQGASVMCSRRWHRGFVAEHGTFSAPFLSLAGGLGCAVAYALRCLRHDGAPVVFRQRGPWGS